MNIKIFEGYLECVKIPSPSEVESINGVWIQRVNRPLCYRFDVTSGHHCPEPGRFCICGRCRGQYCKVFYTSVYRDGKYVVVNTAPLAMLEQITRDPIDPLLPGAYESEKVVVEIPDIVDDLIKAIDIIKEWLRSEWRTLKFVSEYYVKPLDCGMRVCNGLCVDPVKVWWCDKPMLRLTGIRTDGILVVKIPLTVIDKIYRHKLHVVLPPSARLVHEIRGIIRKFIAANTYKLCYC